MKLAVKQSVRRNWLDIGSRAGVVAIPALAWIGTVNCSPSPRMWILCFAMFASWKVRTLATAIRQHPQPSASVVGYLFLWPGMDGRRFFNKPKNVVHSLRRESVAASFFTATGGILLAIAARHLAQEPLWSGAFGLAGLICLFHFGLFHWLSILWRWAGVDAQPIMNAPWVAKSLADFWGRRWNEAFHSAVNTHLFRPLARHTNAKIAMLVVFLVSGLIHDFVISVPAQGGYGLPTLYFLLQAAGLFLQRRLGVPSRAWHQRVSTWFVVVTPLPLLFHGPFLRRVIAPTVGALADLF